MLLVHGLNKGQHKKNNQAGGPKHDPVCGQYRQKQHALRARAIIACGRCVACALDSMSHTSGNHKRQGRHGKQIARPPAKT
jgi:hypothetical protein